MTRGGLPAPAEEDEEEGGNGPPGHPEELRGDLHGEVRGLL